MKKTMFLMTLLLAANVLFAQEEVKKSQPPQSKEMEQVILAQQLANFGYTHKDPLALLTASKIIASNPVSEFKPETESSKKPETESSGSMGNMLNPKTLLEDAVKMSGNDPTIIAISEKITFPKTKGSPQGPQLLRGFIGPQQTDEYTCVFRANELAEVAVVGDGYADLDLFIYDLNNNLIVSDVRSLTDAYCAFIPYYTVTFRMVVKNTSRTNSSEYLIGVN